MSRISITFETGVGTVTGANFLVKTERVKFLVDCGLVQGEEFATSENRTPFRYNPSEIDYLFVTHAHLDHVGRIPKLVKDGFRGEIYSTPETRELGRLILEDAVVLLAKEAVRDGVLPLYEKEDLEKAFSLWKDVSYHTPLELPQGFSIFLKDAGHILGSSMIEFTFKTDKGDKKVVFTGDLGNSPTPLLKDTETIEGADYVVMESVYGDRNHEPSRERKEKLKQVIQNTIARGGVTVIPAFSLERTQVILYELNDLIENNELPHVPVFVDSPLATKITEIYKRSKLFFNKETQERIKGGDDIFNFPRLKFTLTSDDSRAIERIPGPKIIIAGSGMSVGGRVTHHEINYLPDPKNTLLLVGYQSLGTIGRQLQDGANKVQINGSQVKVKAHIDTIWGYSSHKDSEHLISFAETAQKTVKKVFVVMGEPKASLFLVQRLRDYLGIDALYPEKGKEYELDIEA
jgi:metallo-beta-lactamase family protein